MNDFIKPTGDPFIDVGGFVLEYLIEKSPGKTILEHIAYATDIYVKYWGGDVHPYFLNSSITQSKFSDEKKIKKTLEYYTNLIEGKNLDFTIGQCRIMGSETKLYITGRHNFMMVASSAFINFHSAYESGLYLSKEALIRAFFVPLGVSFVGDKIALLQSNYEMVSRFLVRKNVEDNLKNVSSGIAEGTLKSEFGLITNALFNYADFCINSLPVAVLNDDNSSVNLTDVQLNMYHFTNFAAKPDINLYTFPSLLFKFYGHCKRNYSKEWNLFINQHYQSSKFKNAEFDEKTQEWFNKKERLSRENYKVWDNIVLNKLLNNHSIISLLLKWSKRNKFNFNIIEIYCLTILKMKPYTIQKIKELADFIINDKSEDEIKKSITELNSFGKSGVQSLRQFLIKLIRENYSSKNPKPLITIEDFVFHLFPEGTNWMETRDLLLIAIYQRLHETQKPIVDLSQDSEELEDDNIN